MTWSVIVWFHLFPNIKNNHRHPEFISIYTLIFYWPILTQMRELLPQFWSQDLEIFSIACQWYEDVPQERIFGSHPHNQLQAQKGVVRVDLEALLLTLEHILLNTCCQGLYTDLSILYEFSDLTPHSLFPYCPYDSP